MMPNSDPRDKFVYRIHKRMLVSFLAYVGYQCSNKSSFIFKYLAFTSAILNKTDVILTFLGCCLMTKLGDVLNNQQDMGPG